MIVSHKHQRIFPRMATEIPFISKITWKGKQQEKKMNAITFHSRIGTSVALLMSTVNHDLHWDFVPKSDKHIGWYFDKNLSDHEPKMNGFDKLIGESTKEIEQVLLDLVLPCSCGSDGQVSKEWFLDKMFSGTSSQIHFLIQATMPLLMSNDNIDHNTKKISVLSQS